MIYILSTQNKKKNYDNDNTSNINKNAYNSNILQFFLF